MLPLSESLSVAFDWAPPQLRTPQLKKGIAHLARVLNSGVSSCCFEWSLEKSGVFDLLFLITKRESLNFLARLKEQQSLCAQPEWHSIIRFINIWNSNKIPVIAAIPHILLAFDFSERAHRFNPPNIHFCIDRNFSRRREFPASVSHLSKPQMKSILGRLFPNFLASNTNDVLRQAENCFSLLPTNGEVLRLSIMHARQPQTVKFNMALPRSTLIPYLAKIGWPGDRAMVAAVLDEFCLQEKRVKCNILMNSTILNKLEMEFDYDSTLAVDPRRERTIDLLHNRNYASKSACTAVRRWPGYDWEPVRNGKWPAKIKKWLDIKMCMDENKKMTAKAYLGFYPFFSIV
jgi:hypothetical protein